jgi:hypothetical protein
LIFFLIGEIPVLVWKGVGQTTLAGHSCVGGRWHLVLWPVSPLHPFSSWHSVTRRGREEGT